MKKLIILMILFATTKLMHAVGDLNIPLQEIRKELTFDKEDVLARGLIADLMYELSQLKKLPGEQLPKDFNNTQQWFMNTFNINFNNLQNFEALPTYETFREQFLKQQEQHEEILAKGFNKIEEAQLDRALETQRKLQELSKNIVKQQVKLVSTEESFSQSIKTFNDIGLKSSSPKNDLNNSDTTFKEALNSMKNNLKDYGKLLEQEKNNLENMFKIDDQ